MISTLRRSRRRTRVALAALLVAVVAAAVLVVVRRGTDHTPSAAQRAARAAGVSFLDHWVDGDGRVVRRDQGGDTVSEGQAYGLLVAVAIGDRTRFARIWSWTKANLQRDDALLAWTWKDGHVQDPQPAADGDVDAAWALLLAGRNFGDGAYTSDGRRLAQAVLDRETVPAAPGRVLVGGPWARTAPYELNPSYLVAGTAAMFARATGAAGWSDVARGEAALDATLVSGAHLPPDWARLDAGPSGGASPADTAHPAGAPNGSTGVGYNLDAPRLVVRLAASCTASDRQSAAQVRPLLASTGEPTQRNLDGTPAGSYTHPLSDVAVAAAASAHGNAAATASALDAAAGQLRNTPTYYGAAWVALGRILLATAWLGSCALTGGKS